MLIGDWSSAVCSSDLSQGRTAARYPQPPALARFRVRLFLLLAFTELDDPGIAGIVVALLPHAARRAVGEAAASGHGKIGRAPLRERGGSNWESPVAAESLKNKKNITRTDHARQ